MKFNENNNICLFSASFLPEGIAIKNGNCMNTSLINNMIRTIESTDIGFGLILLLEILWVFSFPRHKNVLNGVNSIMLE